MIDNKRNVTIQCTAEEGEMIRKHDINQKNNELLQAKLENFQHERELRVSQLNLLKALKGNIQELSFMRGDLQVVVKGDDESYDKLVKQIEVINDTLQALIKPLLRQKQHSDELLKSLSMELQDMFRSKDYEAEKRRRIDERNKMFKQQRSKK